MLANTPFTGGKLTIESPGLLPAVRHLSYLGKLEVDVEELPDLGTLHDVPHVTEIYVRKLGSADLRPLAEHATSLTSLYIFRESPVKDLSPIRQLHKLTKLAITAEDPANLDSLLDMPKLERVYLDGLANIDDFSAIAALGCLKILSLGECHHLTTLGQLPRLGSLEGLGLDESALDCGLARLLEQLPQLKYLALKRSNWVSDLSPLAGLPLMELGVPKCRSVHDISPLATCGKLAYLHLGGTAISDISALAALPELRVLRLNDCHEVTDLSPLANLRKLKHLFVPGIARQADLSPLAGNRKLEVYIYPDQEILNRESLGRRVRFCQPE